PRRHRTEASPGLLCSPSLRPAASAMRVCRRRAPVRPYTVTELRPLLALLAAESCCSASVLIDGVSMPTDGFTAGGCGGGTCGPGRCPTNLTQHTAQASGVRDTVQPSARAKAAKRDAS